jgi:hypothetical protein
MLQILPPKKEKFTCFYEKCGLYCENLGYNLVIPRIQSQFFYSKSSCEIVPLNACGIAWLYL